MKRKLKKVALWFSGFVILGAVCAVEFVLPYIGIKPYRLKPDASHHWRYPKGINAEDYGLKAEKIFILTRDSIRLQAYLCAPQGDSCFGAAVVLHGLSSNKETQFNRAATLAEAGYASLLLDLRAHGASEGEYNSFGYREKYDVQTAIDTLKKRYPGLKTGVWGASLGGAIALQAMGHDPRIEFGIIESTFDEYYKVAIEYGEDYTGLRSEALARHVIAKAGRIAAFSPDSISPCQYAARITVPILFIHGDRDEKIPMDFNRENYEACASRQKYWITVQGAGHGDVWHQDPERLKKAVRDLLKNAAE